MTVLRANCFVADPNTTVCTGAAGGTCPSRTCPQPGTVHPDTTIASGVQRSTVLPNVSGAGSRGAPDPGGTEGSTLFVITHIAGRSMASCDGVNLVPAAG